MAPVAAVTVSGKNTKPPDPTWMVWVADGVDAVVMMAALLVVVVPCTGRRRVQRMMAVAVSICILVGVLEWYVAELLLDSLGEESVVISVE